MFWFLDSKHLATLRIVLPLDQNYSSIWVESNFVRAGFKNSFSVSTKVVFFGVLRFLSSMRSVVSGTLQIETVFHVNRRPVSLVGRATDCCAGGRRFKPRPDQHLGSLNN